MLSRNAGELFTDMSGEAKDPFEANHPDVQILAFNPKSPERPVHRRRDGGIVRTSGRYVNDSSGLLGADRNLSGLDLTECQMFLSYIPDDLITMNEACGRCSSRTAAESSNPLGEAIGGTQDNGTLGFSGSGTWLNFVSGDGGQSGIDVTQGNIRYHTYFAQQGDVNFRGNDPQWWSWIYDPILFSPEASVSTSPSRPTPSSPRRRSRARRRVEDLERRRGQGLPREQLQRSRRSALSSAPASTLGAATG